MNAEPSGADYDVLSCCSIVGVDGTLTKISYQEPPKSTSYNVTDSMNLDCEPTCISMSSEDIPPPIIPIPLSKLTRTSSLSNVASPELRKFMRSISCPSVYFTQESYLCPICLMYCMLYKSWSIEGCEHRVCRTCLCSYLSSRIEDGLVDTKCPHIVGSTQCTNTIPYNDVRILIGRGKAITKFERFIAMKDPLNRLCPYCEYVQLGDPEHPWMSCIQCNRQYCFTHSLAHEANEPCRTFERRMRKQNRASRELIKHTCKDCPGCGAPTLKVSGCNHITCRCGAEWCWLCGHVIILTGPYPAHYDVINVTSSCAGRQFDDNTGPPSFKTKLLRWSLFPLHLLFFLIGLVLYAILTILLLPCWVACCRQRWIQIRYIVDYILLFSGFILVFVTLLVVTLAAYLISMVLWPLASPIYVPLAVYFGWSLRRWLMVPCWPYTCVNWILAD